MVAISNLFSEKCSSSIAFFENLIVLECLFLKVGIILQSFVREGSFSAETCISIISLF